MADDNGGAQTLEERIKGVVDDYLRDPLQFPAEFRGWVPDWVQTVGIEMPRSQVTGLYTTSTSVGGLGEAAPGRTCMLRAGASPFSFVQLTFDDTYGKWVSDQVWFSFQISSSASFNTMSPSWGDVVGTSFPRFVIPGFKDLYDAGARPQVFLSAFIQATGSATASLRINFEEIEDGDTAGSSIATAGSISHNTSTVTFKTSGWLTTSFSGAPTDDQAQIKLQGQTSDGTTGTATFANAAIRWVADEA